jgi:hypothetical protein
VCPLYSTHFSLDGPNGWELTVAVVFSQTQQNQNEDPIDRIS